MRVTEPHHMTRVDKVALNPQLSHTETDLSFLSKATDYFFSHASEVRGEKNRRKESFAATGLSNPQPGTAPAGLSILFADAMEALFTEHC